MSNKYLMILGAPKTGTSNLVAMLNCCPEIFIMFELFPGKRIFSRYTERIYSYYKVPEKKRIKNIENINKVLSHFKNIMDKENNYKYFGDKWPYIPPSPNKIKNTIKEMSGFKIIFLIRDIRTWGINKRRAGDKRTCEKIILYLYYIIYSFKLKDVMHVRMEDLIYDRNKVVDELSYFLSVDREHFINYYDKINNYNDANKYINKFWIRKKSVSQKPNKLRIVAKENNHDFWKDTFPIFKKYYNSLSCPKDINSDLKKVKELYHKYRKIRLSIDDLYKNVSVIDKKTFYG